MTTLADPSRALAQPAQAVSSATAAPNIVRVRDSRLDVFRGIAMFIILIAHIPNNWLTLWIPARFGFSDATEIFVFCSGMASAIAFGGTFSKSGWWLGTWRVAYRVWQVYWAHIGLFFAVATAMALLVTHEIGTRDYVGQLNLYPFFNDPLEQLPGLVSLTYVPNYFDILPMYLVILVLLPVMMALSQISVWLVAGGVLLLWLGANIGGLNFGAEPWSERQWFFNPFGWQLIFFTGFGFMIGWIPAPARGWRLAVLAAVIVLLIVPFAYFRIIGQVPEIQAWRRDWNFLIQKTDFGLLRYIHFLALAYLAWFACGPGGQYLTPPEGDTVIAKSGRAVLAMIKKVGQQSLGIFILSMFSARLYGVLLDILGRSHWSMLVVNMLSFAILIAAAYFLGWIKSQPWRKVAK